MQVEYINPFIESIGDFFGTMLGSSAERGPIGLTRGAGNGVGVRSLIGLSGAVRGTVVLCLPHATANAIVASMLGIEDGLDDACITDGVAEAVNIVAGGAKSKFPRIDAAPIALSLPTVIRGEHVNLGFPSSSVWIEIPFRSGLGDFTLCVTFESNYLEKGNEG